MRIHILGVCGTFMAGIAVIAKQLGHDVIGVDEKFYSPMHEELLAQNITLQKNYKLEHLAKTPDIVIIGNVIKRGNPILEYILNNNIPYVSGPQWIYENVLCNKWVLAVAGTHGKTTTSSILTWILECAGKNPGFLIGGIPENFHVSARLTNSDFFIIEADEYDCAFFDKRSKFLHYHPKTLILNNLEFDHADIFKNLAAIKTQFHHLIRTVAANSLIISNAKDNNLKNVLSMGAWANIKKFNDENGWHIKNNKIFSQNKSYGEIIWDLLGAHNNSNALAAILAAEHIGININDAMHALVTFKNVKRRLEIKGAVNGVTVYDDFAHHPTAIKATINALRKKIGADSLAVIIELGSYTMRAGFHKNNLLNSLNSADFVFIKKPNDFIWDFATEKIKNFPCPLKFYHEQDQIISDVLQSKTKNILIMSNTGFNGIANDILAALNT